MPPIHYIGLKKTEVFTKEILKEFPSWIKIFSTVQYIVTGGRDRIIKLNLCVAAVGSGCLQLERCKLIYQKQDPWHSSVQYLYDPPWYFSLYPFSDL